MTKKAPKSGPLSPSCSGGSSRNLELAVKSSEGARRSTRLRLQPLRKPKSSPKKKKPVKLHSKMPKKPPTAFFFFLEDFRKQYQEENPEVKSMREVIGKTCGEKWKTMTYEEKVKYYDIATEKREEFHRAMTEYTKRMESGGYDESETDSEYS
ncbi:high mobility group family protein, partial [Arabidopsis lyrata subsp. lyrata]